MKIIAVISLKGGVGRTTVAAGLARVIAERARAVAVDLDPQNALGLHLGMAVGEPRGIVDPSFDGRGLIELLRGQQPEVPYVPFGRCDVRVRVELEAALATTPTWLGARLTALCPPGTEYVVLDTPAGHGPWLDQALAHAHLILTVTTADAASYALLADSEGLLEAVAQERAPTPPTAAFLINRLDPRRELGRDLRGALANALGDRLLPTALLEDEAVREAVAERQTAVQFAPHSQYSVGLREVAAWALKALR